MSLDPTLRGLPSCHLGCKTIYFFHSQAKNNVYIEFTCKELIMSMHQDPFAGKFLKLNANYLLLF